MSFTIGQRLTVDHSKSLLFGVGCLTLSNESSENSNCWKALVRRVLRDSDHSETYIGMNLFRLKTSFDLDGSSERPDLSILVLLECREYVFL